MASLPKIRLSRRVFSQKKTSAKSPHVGPSRHPPEVTKKLMHHKGFTLSAQNDSFFFSPVTSVSTSLIELLVPG